MRGEPRAPSEPLPGDGTGGPGNFRSAHRPSKKLCGPSHFLGPLLAAGRILTSSIKVARRACMNLLFIFLYRRTSCEIFVPRHFLPINTFLPHQVRKRLPAQLLVGKRFESTR